MAVKKSHKMYIYKRDGGKCYYCGKELSVRQISLDHYLPRSSSGTDDIFNIVLSCKKCNREKTDSVPNNYQEVLIKLFKKAVVDRKVTFPCAKLKHDELVAMVRGINRLESINKFIVFQSADARFYVKSNQIAKVVRLDDRSSIYK